MKGNITTQITEMYNKIRIANSAIFFPEAEIEAFWEVEFECNVTFLVYPKDSFPTARIRAPREFPINISGVHVNFLFNPNFHGLPIDREMDTHILSEVLEIYPTVGQFELPFTTIGQSPLCEYNGGVASYNRGSTLYANFTCPMCSVYPTDFLYLPFVIFPLCFVLILALSKLTHYSAWKLVHLGFAMVMISVVVVCGFLALVLYENARRSEADAFCYHETTYHTFTAAVTLGLPVCGAVACILLGISWFNVVAFNFPRESSKSSERFCAGYSPSQRVSWYFILWILLVALLGLTVWAPLCFALWVDTVPIIITVAVVPPAVTAEIILITSWICLTTCCTNDKFDKYFAESSVEYLTIQSSGFE